MGHAVLATSAHEPGQAAILRHATSRLPVDRGGGLYLIWRADTWHVRSSTSVGWTAVSSFPAGRSISLTLGERL